MPCINAKCEKMSQYEGVIMPTVLYGQRCLVGEGVIDRSVYVPEMCKVLLE